MTLSQKIKSHRWDLALACCEDEKTFLRGEFDWHVVSNPDRSRWYADPQILRVEENEIVLLVEEFEYERGKGRIAELKIDKGTFTVQQMKIILERPTHLSFPAIIREGSKIFVHPENSESGKHYLYEYKDGALQNPQIMAEVPLTDAVTFNFSGRAMMSSTSLPSPNGSQLSLFEKDGDAYSRVKEIEFADNVARNAGDVVNLGGRLIRPAQICNNLYGEGICLQEIIPDADGLPSFSHLTRIYPPEPYDGMHTLNFRDGWAVTDMRCYNHPFVHGVLSKIKHFAEQ